MSSPERSDLFEDPREEIARLREQIEAVRQEAKTAGPERRKEIGWWIFGAEKWIGRLMDVNLARRFGEHRFIVHEVEDGTMWAVCSCGARFRGMMHEDFTLEEFAALDGHQRD